MREKQLRRSAWLALAAVLALAGLPARAQAGDCYARPRTYYAPSYSYSYPPAYSYTPTYTVPNYVAPCETKLKTVPYPNNPDYYSSVSDYYRDKLLTDAIAGRTAEVLKAQVAETEKARELQLLKDEVQLLRQRLLYQPQPGGGPPAPPYQPPARPPLEEQPRREAPPKERPPTMPRAGRAHRDLPRASDRLKASVAQSCLRCHGDNHAAGGGGLDLRNLDALDRETRLQMYAEVNIGRMPKGSKPLSDDVIPEYVEFATGEKLAAAQK